MFKAKRIDTGEVETILAVDYYDALQQTYFLVWKDGWRWRPAHRYVPPNVDPKDIAPINVRTQINEDNSIK